MNYSSAFWDRIATRYAKSPVADEAAYQHKLAVTRQYLTPQSEVLEFGCGTGSTAIAHAPFVKHILATDFSEKMLEIAREKAQGVDNLDFEQATLRDIAGEERFDAVLGLSVLHLVEDLEATLGDVHRLLRPGGVFVSSTMCMSDGYAWFRYIGPLGRALGLFPALTMFSRTELEEHIRKAGFAIDYRFQPTRKKALFIVANKL